MSSTITESSHQSHGKTITYNLLRILIASGLIAMSILIRTRQDLFVYENGNMGAMSPELIAILIIGMFLDWDKIYPIILVLMIIASLFHFVFIGIADHLTGKLILLSIEAVMIIALIAIIRIRKKEKTA